MSPARQDSKEETKRMSATLKWALAFAGLFFAGGGAGGGIYTYKSVALSREDIRGVVETTMNQSFKGFDDRLAKVEAENIQLRGQLASLSQQASTDRTMLSMLNNHLVPTVASLQDKLNKVAEDIAFLRGQAEKR